MKSFFAFGSLFLLACSGAPGGSATNSAAPVAGSDIAYTYTITTLSHGKPFVSQMMMFLSAGGNARVEMQRPTPSDPTGKTTKMVIIGHSDQPNQSTTIDDEAKTYTINHLDLDSLGSPYKMESQATKIGEEKIDGFSCIHARIISHKIMGNFYNDIDTIDLWRSNEVPVQAMFQHWVDRYESRTTSMLYAHNVIGQLQQMGCNGFMVRMDMHSKDASMRDELTKVEQKSLSNSLFQVPSGYKESKD